MKFLGFGTSTIADVDANTRALLTCPRPVDSGLLGSFRVSNVVTGQSQSATNQCAFSFRNVAPNGAVCVLREIRVNYTQFGSSQAGSGQLVTFKAFRATGWSTADGGTVSTLSPSLNGPITGRMRSAPSNVQSLAEIKMTNGAGFVTAGTRNLDASPFAMSAFSGANGLTQTLSPGEDGRMFKANIAGGQWPMVFGPWEGFVLNYDNGALASMSEGWGITVVWDERIAFP